MATKSDFIVKSGLKVSTDATVTGNVTANSFSGNGVNLTSVNSSTVGGNTASDLRTYADQKSDNAYSNAVSYVDGKSYVNTSQLSTNLANYQTTAGLAANVATLTANNTSFVGTVSAANVVSNAQLSNNLANYALLSGASFSGNVTANNANTLYNLNVGGNLTVAGNLTVTGNVTTIGANNLSIVDNFIYLNSNNTTQNEDIGIAGNYNDGTYAHTGIFRDATDGYWKVFDGYTPEPDAAVNIDTSNNTFNIAGFWANNIRLGNTTVYSTANSTVFSGTANNTSFVGTVPAANVVSDIQLSSNLSNYAALAGASFTGNVSIGTTNTSASFFTISNTYVLDASATAHTMTIIDANTSMTAGARTKTGFSSSVETNNEHRYANGATVGFGGNYEGGRIVVLNGNATSGGAARSNILTGLYVNASSFANGTSANSARALRAVYATNIIGPGSNVSSSATSFTSYMLHNSEYGLPFAYSYNSVITSVGSNSINTVYGYSTSISANIVNGYLFYGSYATNTGTTTYGVYANNEQYNYFSGNVGIGNATPTDKLSVNGTTYLGANVTLNAALIANGGAGTAGQVLTTNGTATYWSTVTSGAGVNVDSTYAWTNVHTFAANVGIGTASPGYKLQVNGSFAATTKSFVIDHPTKPGMKLRYGSLEGPENGVYVRGESTSKVIELPDYWEGLVDEDTITVTLTPIGKKQSLYVKEIKDNAIVIGGNWKPHFYYTVYAERRDVEKLVVEF